MMKQSSMNEIDIFFAKRALPEATEAQSAFLQTLMAMARQGHLCMRVDQGKISPDLSDGEIDPSLVLEGAKTLPENVKFVKREGNCWYLERNWKFENKFVHHLKRLASSPAKISLPCFEADETLQPEQKEALKKAFTHTVSLISGGPGTGKSYIASRFVTHILPCVPKDFRIVVAAPTGKAAAHLESKIPKDPRIRCGTLHLLLNVRQSAELNGEGGYLGADVLIVDECSMIDVRLFSYLLASLESGCRVVLMGDANQLPPVDAGSLFADLLCTKYDVAITELKRCMRSDRIEILSMAEAIREGNAENLEVDEEESLDLYQYFMAPSDEMPKIEQIQKLCILSSMRQGPWGVDHLNASVASYFLSKAKKGQYFVAPILVNKNDYAQKIYNGQTGILVRRIGYEEEDKLIFPDREILAGLVSHFEYAYVLSVHKSQGSEYDHVVLLVPPGSEVFGREVLYTAVTRARLSVKIKGKKDVLRQVVARSSRKLSGLSISN
jgi:exodeoxyribonuclease V alpha subunit